MIQIRETHGSIMINHDTQQTHIRQHELFTIQIRQKHGSKMTIHDTQQTHTSALTNHDTNHRDTWVNND